MGRWHVHPFHILMEHTDSGELPDGARDRASHLGRPAFRNAIFIALVIERHDFLLEDPVDILSVAVVLSALIGVYATAADRPAVVADPALVPPAVEHGQVDNAVAGGLHAARAGRLQRAARVVRPHVHALNHESSDPHVVVLEDEDPTA